MYLSIPITTSPKLDTYPSQECSPSLHQLSKGQLPGNEEGLLGMNLRFPKPQGMVGGSSLTRKLLGQTKARSLQPKRCPFFLCAREASIFTQTIQH